MNARHLLFGATLVVLSAVWALGESQPAQRIEVTSPGRYQLESGTVPLDQSKSMPTMFRIDTQTGQVDYLVPMPTGSGGTLAVWNRTYTMAETRAERLTGN